MKIIDLIWVNTYGLDTMTLTEKQQEEVHVCKNWKRIVGVKKAEEKNGRTESGGWSEGF